MTEFFLAAFTFLFGLIGIILLLTRPTWEVSWADRAFPWLFIAAAVICIIAAVTL